MTRPSASDLVSVLRELPSDALAFTDERERVRARLERSIAAFAAPADGTPGPVTGSHQPAPLGGSALGHGASAARRLAAAWLAPAFVAGTLAGVAADRLWMNRTAHDPAKAVSDTSMMRNPSPPAALSALAVTPPPAAPKLQTGEPKPSAIVATEPPEAARSASPAPDATLDAEQRLLDAARTALARGEPAGGIPALQRHATRFPKGQLTEEREALWIRILVAVERDGDATARIASFRRRFPDSLFAPVVDNAAATISRRQEPSEPKP